MLESKNGPQIMEVNSSPGLEGIERSSQLDIAGAVVFLASAAARFMTGQVMVIDGQPETAA